MRIPVINTDPQLEQSVLAALRAVSGAVSGAAADPTAGAPAVAMEAVPVRSAAAAIEYINYQMPVLVLINFSDPALDAFAIMEQVVADPWLNNGGIIAFYSRSEHLDRLNELREANIIITLDARELGQHLATVLKVVRDNQHILIQRSIQTDLLHTITGNFELGMDLLLVPCTSNLISNYLYHMGFVDGAEKTRTALILTEMLTNAIEHGNCGITAQEKTAYLERYGTIRGLIVEKCRDPAIAARTVRFSYEINRDGSHFVIRDQGQGFDWRTQLERSREVDVMALNGRGIMLTVQAVSAIAYNEPGNEVTLHLTHRQNTSNTLPSAFRDSEIVEVRPEDVIFRQGEESSFIYYLAEGEYRVMVNGHQIATMSPKDILLGEMSFLLEEKRNATVIANTPGRLIRISKEALVNSIKSHPYYGMFLAKLLAQRLAKQGQRDSREAQGPKQGPAGRNS